MEALRRSVVMGKAAMEGDLAECALPDVKPGTKRLSGSFWSESGSRRRRENLLGSLCATPGGMPRPRPMTRGPRDDVAVKPFAGRSAVCGYAGRLPEGRFTPCRWCCRSDGALSPPTRRTRSINRSLRAT